MNNASKVTVLGLILTTGFSLCAPLAASADGVQQTKNTWRNIATGAAILAGVGIANHNGTETALGAIGTVVGLSQYEQARHEQSVQQNGYGDNGYYNNGPQGGYDNGGLNVGVRFDQANQANGWGNGRGFRQSGRDNGSNGNQNFRRDNGNNRNNDRFQQQNDQRNQGQQLNDRFQNNGR